MNSLLDASQTAERLPYGELAQQVRALLGDATVQVPQRLVQPLPGGGSLFVMPAFDARIAITKLITFTPANAGTARPAIQGDVLVFDVATGERLLLLDGPTVTARRTAAVSLLAAQQLAHVPQGPLLIVGAAARGAPTWKPSPRACPCSRCSSRLGGWAARCRWSPTPGTSDSTPPWSTIPTRCWPNVRWS